MDVLQLCACGRGLECGRAGEGGGGQQHDAAEYGLYGGGPVECGGLELVQVLWGGVVFGR